MLIWIIAVGYVLGIIADYVDSRRDYYIEPWKAALLAIVWPITWAIQVAIAIIRLPRR